MSNTPEPSISSPTAGPTASPIVITEQPSAAPTVTTWAPSPAPTFSPSVSPTWAPSFSPTIMVFERPVLRGLSGSDTVKTPLEFKDGRDFDFLSFRLKVNETLEDAELEFDVPEGKGGYQTMAMYKLINITDPFLFAPLIKNDSMPIPSSDILPNGVWFTPNATLIGTPMSLMDLTALAATCIMFPIEAGPPIDFSASLLLPSLDLFVKAYGASGRVDPLTGQMIGFRSQQEMRSNLNETSYPASLPQPVFCDTTWFGISVYSQKRHNVNILVKAFNTVRTGGEVDMVYTDNPDFFSYEFKLFLFAIPFFAMLVICVIIYPSFVLCRAPIMKCFNYFCGRCASRVAKSCKDRCCRKYQQCRCYKCCCACCRKDKLKNANIQDLQQAKLIEEVIDTPTEDEDLIEINKRLELEETELKEGSIQFYQSRINNILRSPSISKRMCYVLVLILSCGFCVAISIGMHLSIVSNNQANEDFSSVRALMILAKNETDTALMQVQSVLQSQSVPGSDKQILVLMQDHLARASSLLLPDNLRVSNDWKAVLDIGPNAVNAVEIAVLCVQWSVPILIFLSIVLSSCTCRWNDTVLFENFSICLGIFLRNWLMICAAVGWFGAAFTFWDVSVFSDICALPSILAVPDLGDSLLTEPVDYSDSNNNYYFPYGEDKSILAAFLGNCFYPSVPFVNMTKSGGEFNPFSVWYVQTGELYNQLNNDAISNQLAQVPETLQRAMDITSCARMGTLMDHGIHLKCEDNIIGVFLQFFFVTALAIQYMIVIPCADYVAPNLYRQWKANKEYERYSKKLEAKLRKVETMARETSRAELSSSSQGKLSASGLLQKGSRGSLPLIAEQGEADEEENVGLMEDMMSPNNSIVFSPSNGFQHHDISSYSEGEKNMNTASSDAIQIV